jgi:hypothetical protein
MADHAKHPAADDRANDPKYYIKNKALPLLIDDFAGNEARNETQDYPADDRHARSSLSLNQFVRTMATGHQRQPRGSLPPVGGNFIPRPLGAWPTIYPSEKPKVSQTPAAPSCDEAAALGTSCGRWARRKVTAIENSPTATATAAASVGAVKRGKDRLDG